MQQERSQSLYSKDQSMMVHRVSCLSDQLVNQVVSGTTVKIFSLRYASLHRTVCDLKKFLVTQLSLGGQVYWTKEFRNFKL